MARHPPINYNCVYPFVAKHKSSLSQPPPPISPGPSSKRPAPPASATPGMVRFGSVCQSVGRSVPTGCRHTYIHIYIYNHISLPSPSNLTIYTYTPSSGTTGFPKGVLYSHRSTVLHSYAAALPDSLNLSARDVAMPVVPLFHVNAWGMLCTCMGSGYSSNQLSRLFWDKRELHPNTNMRTNNNKASPTSPPSSGASSCCRGPRWTGSPSMS